MVEPTADLGFRRAGRTWPFHGQRSRVDLRASGSSPEDLRSEKESGEPSNLGEFE
jgi:hypothetical protein